MHRYCISIAFVLSVATAPVSAEIAATKLRCEYQNNPTAIDIQQPRLSWVVESSERGQKQTAYQICAAESPDALAGEQNILWDSGKVSSDRSIQIVYAGKHLHSGMRCHWKVRLWDKDDIPSPWSEPAVFSIALLSQDDWKANWIGLPKNERLPSTQEPYLLPILRKEFMVAKHVECATVYVCGLGQYELFLNAVTVGDHVFDPDWTNYRKSCHYATYDVTSQIRDGANAFAVILGNGIYNWQGGRKLEPTRSFGPPKMILQLCLQYADGTTTHVVSDSTWKTSVSPITFSDFYGGEDYDARREAAGWKTPGFDDASWSAAAVVPGPGGKLVSQMLPPIKVMESFSPVKITEPSPGVTIYDFGQNCSARPRISVKGRAGAQIKLIPDEALDEQGRMQQRFGPCYFTYTLKGGNAEEWAPRFSSSGYRYIQAETTGDDAAGVRPQILAIASEHLRSSAETAGHFSCSNDLFNRIHRMIDWAIRSNMWSILTDCPHRERMGWLEQCHLMGPSIMYNYDVALLFEKICADMSESQMECGLVPDISPEYVVHPGGFRDAPAWGSSSVILPWLLFQWYSDSAILARHYEMMKRYVDYLTSKRENGLVRHGLGDWSDSSGNGFSTQTPLPAVESAIYYYDLVLLSQTARLLGKTQDADHYEELSAQVCNAYNREFFHPDTCQYASGSQTCNAMPLALGMVVSNRQTEVLANIVHDIRAHGDHLTSGDIGHRFLLRALADNDRSDVVYDMTDRVDPPGYGWQLEKGMTSLAETWDASSKNSLNHLMLGHIEEWFYHDLAGIQLDLSKTGPQRLRIKPAVVGDLTWVKASYDSVVGRIVSNWTRNGDEITMDVTVPGNVIAAVYVPTCDAASVQEGGRPAAEAPCVTLLRRDAGAAVYEVGSGHYHFAAKSALSPNDAITNNNPE